MGMQTSRVYYADVGSTKYWREATLVSGKVLLFTVHGSAGFFRLCRNIKFFDVVKR